MTVYVVTAGQAARRDQAAIAAGTPSRELMRRAGEAAARVLTRRLPDEARRGVRVFCGGGNNGGDGWILAATLRRAGFPVEVESVSEPATADARWAREQMPGANEPARLSDGPGVVVDAILGTGAKGELREPVAGAAREIDRLRAHSARVVALDMPTGVDADEGARDNGVTADLTISMGTVKRGQLLARGSCGDVVVVDIGLGPSAELEDGAPSLVDVATVRREVPRFGVEAHKGTRKRVLMVGAAPGMAGALSFAARSAFRSGVGMVRFSGHEASLTALQTLVPQATATPWPAPNDYAAAQSWPHALLIGPGFGVDAEARGRAESWLRSWRGPVVVDADALGCFGSDLPALGALLEGRPALLTPHAVEASRLLAIPVQDVLSRRFEVVHELARQTRACIVLKGVPTLVAAHGYGARVVARGTPVLAQGGSGDALSGIAATLLAQTEDAFVAGSCASWVHGRAGEIAAAGRSFRGVDLDAVLDALPHAWRLDGERLEPEELAALPGVSVA
jgi:NAD(P)H-hydrate epimerase